MSDSNGRIAVARRLRGAREAAGRTVEERKTLEVQSQGLHELGFKIVATGGTAGVLRRVGVEAEEVYRVSDPRGRNVIDLIRDGRIQLIINTPTAGEDPREDQKAIRAAAVLYGIPAITTISGAMVAVMGLESLIKGRLSVKPLQEYHALMRAGAGTD